MSLTGELRDRSSWVSAYFKEWFPATAAFARAMGAEIDNWDRKSDCMPPIGADRSYPWSIVGTAFDYRMRYYLGMDSIFLTTAYEGFIRMQSYKNPKWTLERNDSWARGTYEFLKYELDSVMLNSQDERVLSKLCVVLAWFDQGYRSGGIFPKAMDNLLDFPTQQDYLTIVDDQWADDISRLIEKAATSLRSSSLKKIEFGPTFAGSASVGGADADLILNRCLLDIKTTINPANNLAANIRQIVGYVLLDWDNRYSLRSTGLYFSRQGKEVAWPLDELLPQMMGGRNASLNDLRTDFRERAGPDPDDSWEREPTLRKFLWVPPWLRSDPGLEDSRTIVDQ